jgi:Polysaccharide lyase
MILRAALASFSAVLLIHGCHTAKDAKNGDATLPVYDGFEQSTLGPAWASNRFEEGAVVMQSAIVKAGHQAVAVTVRSHDKFEAGRDGNLDTERDELLEPTVLNSQQNIPYESSFSMFFPQDFPIVPTRLVIAQWKQYCGSETSECSDQSPVLALRYINGELIITQAIAGKHLILYREAGEFRNRWLDFRVRTRFTPNNDGHVAVWLGDRQLIDYHGATADPEGPGTGYANPSRFFFKMGLYRDLMTQPMTVYIDEYRKRELKVDEF